ncbi:hypothetical protein PTSG_07435 [Salpingoeca rosetta]|uniref:EF-hand domain-containing protein n=1 Tax=Salpingoeca rosetta (strain ATCC 50818 / BSB-021) TaxID=946362 RepID=F2UIP8_SALR5|nr:uncharacterized protein PTSG_07435 [Salpingoeca rosetta]EGD77097.1 hypothetical protein PTSG_07435 [Salpingoeca rosetta]|eukprot:XP_004990936.1 hypothetical protein PTSG_07435 [Salpingoeca rosetta]
MMSGGGDAEGKVEQFLVEWLSDDAVRAHWTHQVSLLLSNQWTLHAQPPSPVPRPLLPPTHPHSHHHSHSAGAHRSPNSTSNNSSGSSTASGHARTHSPTSILGARRNHQQGDGDDARKEKEEQRARMRQRRRQLKREGAITTSDEEDGPHAQPSLVQVNQERSEKEGAFAGNTSDEGGGGGEGDRDRDSAQRAVRTDEEEQQQHQQQASAQRAHERQRQRRSGSGSDTDGDGGWGDEEDEQTLHEDDSRRRKHAQKQEQANGTQHVKEPSSRRSSRSSSDEVRSLVAGEDQEEDEEARAQHQEAQSQMVAKKKKKTTDDSGGSGFVFPQLFTAEIVLPIEEDMMSEVESAFCQGGTVTLDDFQLICRVCGLPTYLAADMLYACAVTQRLNIVNTEPVTAGGLGAGVTEDNPIQQLPESVPSSAFAAFWKPLRSRYPTAHEKAMHILNPVGNTLAPHHLRRLIYYVIETHPGLDFLMQSPEYHARYVDTVVARIFYTVNRSWSRAISLRELRQSTFLSVLTLLGDDPNINNETEYFSYEHFYVIYTSFWKIDRDRDLAITRDQLPEYGDGGLSPLAMDRIFAHTVFADPNSSTTHMAYWDFVFFMLSEEDKTTRTAIEYWFRIMDIDGDGILSFYELESFYDQQLQQLDEIGVEGMPFVDVLCMNIDMISPKRQTEIRLSDIKRSGMAPRFFNTFLNVNKYLDQEEGDEQDPEYEGASVWHRFASREYILLSSEEDEQSGDGEHDDDDGGGGGDDDDDDDDDGDDDSALHSPLVKY